MGNYGAQGLKTTPSTSVGVCSLEAPASGMRRIKLHDLIVGSDATTLGTSNTRYDVQRSTTAATGTAVTPEPFDPADAASAALFKSALTVQGTNTAGKIPLTIPLNQQASFRWAAAPGREIIIPATASNGLHFNTPVAGGTPPNAVVSVGFEEQ